MSLALVKSSDDVQNDAATFADFWLMYPRRVARKDAERAWNRLSESDRIEALTALVGWRRVWADKDLQFIPHASTWLNGERWTDELPVVSAVSHQSHAAIVGSAGTAPGARPAIPEHVKAVLAKLRK
jgi:hypothetical protein